jgi:carboxypeptidase Q
MSKRKCLPALIALLSCWAVVAVTGAIHAQEAAADLDRRIMAEAKAGTDAIKNLYQLCDEIGPRLTGSKNLQRANEWAAARMKEYGLTNVHQEAWELPEGWRRGLAEGRVIEPDTGVRLTLASYGWHPGTKGKIEADVIALKATSIKELDAYKGKLKGTIVLARPPVKLPPADELLPKPATATAPSSQPPPRMTEELRQYLRELSSFLAGEGAAAMFVDSGKQYGLLAVTGSWTGKDRPSAGTRVPQVAVAHNNYEMLYRLASRPAPARTRVELDVQNEFVPGPMAVHNTIGEIRGTEKPDEVVVVGAHLDSWDLAQGATDNGTGTVVVLETARLLVKSGVKPRRTIRFILFTGEEQGLHGSKAYVERHKDELERVSACLVHDTGTGKIIGVDARHRPVLQPLLAKELAELKALGVTDFNGAFIGGSDHASFDRAGVPGLMFRQESAGYVFNHHTPIDTPDRAIEANLVQGAQVMAVTALRIANLESLLPRDKAETTKKPAAK